MQPSTAATRQVKPVYSFTADQSVICPLCGGRADPIHEDGTVRCLNAQCGYEFVAEMEC
jgi:hypothetical protein